MRVFKVMARERCERGYIVPFLVPGEETSVYEIIQLLIESGSVSPLLKEDFQIWEVDEIHLDPGGMLMMGEKHIDFTLDSLKFSIYPHKLSWMTLELRDASEYFDGWVRVGLGPGSMRSFLYLTREMQEKLLCQLMSLEFVDGVKESKERAENLAEDVFHRGLLARPNEDGSWSICKEGNEEDSSDFDVPEGLEPF